MPAKARLNQLLEKAATLRSEERFTEALDVLQTVQQDADAPLLGHLTSLGLPRRLHSALLKIAKARKDAIGSIGYQYHLVPPPETLNRYTSFTSVERKNIAEANQLSVPKKIHQIWIGSRPPPSSTTAWQTHAARNGYEYQLWQEDKLHQLGIDQNTTYRSMLAKPDLPGAVDVARYLILKRFGGVYLDCDWYPARNDISFHDVLPLTGLNAMAEDTPRNTGKGSVLLANSFIGAPPDHPVFSRLIDAIDTVNLELPKAPAWWSTGPLMFTLMCRGGSITLADDALMAGKLPQGTPLDQVEQWCESARSLDCGLLLAWRSWER